MFGHKYIDILCRAVLTKFLLRGVQDQFGNRLLCLYGGKVDERKARYHAFFFFFLGPTHWRHSKNVAHPNYFAFLSVHFYITGSKIICYHPFWESAVCCIKPFSQAICRTRLSIANYFYPSI